ncbi:coiled-coil domain-containing protein 106-like [Labeo rohita]|uniref:Coiled-coil domain-containing protein 106-like n=1 Tax=Labeo rohita TaxID=84645 RepID=A0A498P1F2_LABRO|nr:coiled-coil domain-containing protein 106-like [Labeo rohita]
MSSTSVPSGDAQNTEINSGTVWRKRKKSTAGTSSKKKATPVDHAVHMDNNGDDTEATVAPTAFLHIKNKQLKLCEAKKKQHTVTEKISDRTKETDSLRQQVGQSTDDARHPEEVIKRYRKVLKAYKKGRKLSVAYRKVGVDRNTIVANAPICELAVVAPKKYKELLVAHTPQQRLQDFAKKCLEVLINDPNLLRDVEHQKKKGKLIPLSTKP